MKNNKWMMAFLMGGALLLSVGCEREKSVETGGIPGTRIVFAALTSYENSDATRTEYSGDVYNLTGTTNQVERIDWVSNGTHKDKFTVNYVAGGSLNSAADYEVTSVNEENYNSKAGVTEADRNSILSWADGSDHKFYAMYPARSVNNDARLTVNNFQATLYPSQPQTHTQSVKAASGTGPSWTRMLPNMDYAYMVAYAGTDNGMISGNSVTLPFRPAVTTFEFRLRRHEGEDGANIRYFKMISASKALTGQYSFDITSGDDPRALWAGDAAVTVPAKTDANSVITVDFGTTGVAIPESTSTSYLDFTIFALPVGYNDLRIQLIDVNGTIRELPLNDKGTGSGHPFMGGKKYVITNTTVPGEWIYVIEASDDIVTYGHVPVPDLPYSVKSYKYSGSTVIPVPWKIQYSVDGGTTWADFNATTKQTATIHGSDPSPVDWNLSFESDILSGLGTGNFTDVNPGVLDLLGTSTGLIQGDEVAAAQRAKLVTHTPRGTVGNEFDLSTHPVYGAIDTPVAQTTANSYVISAPGVYMFPCVYGNGITMGHVNVSAYSPGDADDSYSGVTGDSRAANLKEVFVEHNTDAAFWRAYTPHYYNALNAEITSPYIFDDLSITNPSAVVVWQDTDADNGSFKHQLMPFSSDYVGLTRKNVGGKMVDYIWFKVDADRIKAGNFVIALRGQAGHLTSPEVLWSWHIWVTPDDLTPNDVVTNSTGTYNLMPKNMGWFDSDRGSVSQYPVRDMEFRVVQTESYGKDAGNNPLYMDDTFNVKQIGEADETSPTVGGNVYYQWGRKDPFLPVAPDGTNHPAVYNEIFSPRITITSNGIADKFLPGTALGTNLDYGASIREPYSPYNNNGSPVGYIGGPVYPYEQPGTPVYEYYIQIGRENWGPFDATQATVLQDTDFCDFSDWIKYPAVYPSGNTFYRVDRDFKLGPYTEAQRDYMIATAPSVFTSSDFSGSGNACYLTSKKNGPFDLITAVALNSESGGTDYASSSLWAPVAPGQTLFELPQSYPYHYGPYTQAEADNFVRGQACNPIFDAGLPGSGAAMIANPIGGSGAPYPAAMRSRAANVTNLWNAYQYDEETSGSTYTNKFKTIYDPCPPGFTVPVKQVFVGSRTFSDMDRWTSPLNSMHMKISLPSEVFVGMSPQLISGDASNPEKKGLQLSGGIFLPYTGSRVFRNPGTGNELHAEGMGTAGYYWSDSPLRIDWRYTTDPASPTYNSAYAGPEWHVASDITNGLFWFFFDAYGLIFGSDANYDQYISDSYRVQSYTRATAFSVRPMKDPKVTY